MSNLHHLSPRSQRAWDAFRACVAELGGEVIEETWLGNNAPHRVRCRAGHECLPRPAGVQQGQGICRTCAGIDSGVTQAAFSARIAELGGVVLEETWLGVHAPHRVRCAAGHGCSPRPRGVIRGQGICRTCAGNDPRVAQAAFQSRVTELGGVVLEEKWLGRNAPHRVRCAAGHECTPRPSNVLCGGGICRICASRNSGASWPAFRARVAELGGVVLEQTWLGARTPHRVRCAAGHECTPRPALVRAGGGLCRTCAGNDPKVAEAAFRARATELEAVPLYEKWLGIHARHRVRCAAGHESSPRPSYVLRGGGICRTCSARDSEAAWAAFQSRVAELGGVILEETWLGGGRPHRVRCAAGHECAPRPASVGQGQGLCRICVGQVWDVFYIVMDDHAEHIKFGITSGAPRPRLREHARHGYTTTVRLLEGLPGTMAPDLERAVLSTLRFAGEMPVRGREYYHAAVLPVVLDIVDNYQPAPSLIGRANRTENSE